jgi:hypothetical protein
LGCKARSESGREVDTTEKRFGSPASFDIFASLYAVDSALHVLFHRLRGFEGMEFLKCRKEMISVSAVASIVVCPKFVAHESVFLFVNYMTNFMKAGCYDLFSGEFVLPDPEVDLFGI